MLSLVLLFADCRCGSAAIAMSGAYLILRSWLEQRRFWRPAVVVLLLAWLAVIAMATLTDRTASATSAAPELLPFHSYRAVIAGENKEILRSNFMMWSSSTPPVF